MKRTLHNLFFANAKVGIIVCVSLCLLACNRLSAQAKFSATAPRSGPVNQNFQLNLSVENANGSNPRLPANITNDFQILNGPNTSTSVSIANGAMTQSVTYSYILHPKQEGTFKIGKSTITVDGVTMQS